MCHKSIHFLEGYNKKKQGDYLSCNLNDNTQKNTLEGFAKSFETYNRKLLVEGKLSKDKFELLLSLWGISNPFSQLRYQKVVELTVRKLSRGRKNENCFCRCLKSCCTRWQKRWVVIGFNNIFYYQNFSVEGNQIRDNVPMDITSEIEINDVGKNYVCIDLMMNRRDIKIKVLDFANGIFTLGRIVKALVCSHYTKVHRFGSFAPMREKNSMKSYIRGENYFKEVYRLLETAQKEILIADWYLSPEVPLLRPIEGDLNTEKSCLNHVLERATKRGVRVYVLLYDEFNIGMYNSSEYSKEKLEKINPKMIKVMRHPSGIKALYWSHHEKCVIVDRKVVMMGGIDLCYGRWDSAEPVQLFDYTGDKTFPGMDYYNTFEKEFVTGKDYMKTAIERNVVPRLPWQDIAVQLQGPIVFDFLTHFVTYWNHVKDCSGESEILMSQMYLSALR